MSDTVPFSRRWHITKAALGTTSITCSVILFGIGIYFIAGPYRYRTNIDLAFVLCAAGLALIWQGSEFISICSSSKRRSGIHPGAHVALHLLIWLIAAAAVAFVTTSVIFDHDVLEQDEWYYSTYDDPYYYSDDGDSSPYANPDYVEDSTTPAQQLAFLRRFLALMEATLALTCVLLLVHFALFVRACVETSQWNHAAATRTVYVPVPHPAAGPHGRPAYYYAAAAAPMPMSPQYRDPAGNVYGYYAPPPPPPPPMPQQQQPPIGEKSAPGREAAAVGGTEEGRTGGE